jgi:hypothetical protein
MDLRKIDCKDISWTEIIKGRTQLYTFVWDVLNVRILLPKI